MGIMLVIFGYIARGCGACSAPQCVRRACQPSFPAASTAQTRKKALGETLGGRMGDTLGGMMGETLGEMMVETVGANPRGVLGKC